MELDYGTRNSITIADGIRAPKNGVCVFRISSKGKPIGVAVSDSPRTAKVFARLRTHLTDQPCIVVTFAQGKVVELVEYIPTGDRFLSQTVTYGFRDAMEEWEKWQDRDGNALPPK